MKAWRKSAKSFFFKIFPSMTDFVPLARWMSYGLSHRQEIAWTTYPVKLVASLSTRGCGQWPWVTIWSTSVFLQLLLWRFIWTWYQGHKCTNRASTVPVSPRTYTHWVSVPSSCLTKKTQQKVMIDDWSVIHTTLPRRYQSRKKSKFDHKLYSRVTTLKLFSQKVEF